ERIEITLIRLSDRFSVRILLFEIVGEVIKNHTYCHVLHFVFMEVDTFTNKKKKVRGKWLTRTFFIVYFFLLVCKDFVIKSCNSGRISNRGNSSKPSSHSIGSGIVLSAVFARTHTMLYSPSNSMDSIPAEFPSCNDWSDWSFIS